MASQSASVSRDAVKLALKIDRRDIKDLWNEALKDYKRVLGKDLQSQKETMFKNVHDVAQYSSLQEEVFQKWRHDGKNTDKLRALFMKNIGYIESGTQKLLAAATPAFPPAAAIGAALTFVLTVCKGQSADYDMVTSFFEEMNNFLQRVSILEGRLPEHRAYQACLMDVFSAFLNMCAFATKLISKGRIKTWFASSFMGQDTDLSGARKGVTKNLAILESATQIAILANVEGLKGGQQGLQIMQTELHRNQAEQRQLEREQTQLLEAIQRKQTDVQDGVDALRTELQAIATMMRRREDVSTAPTDTNLGPDQNSIRTSVPCNAENDARMRKLQTTRIQGTAEWLFQAKAWKSWSASQENGTLLVRGPLGVGKSHLAIAAHDRLFRAATDEPGQYSLVTYFFCDSDVSNLSTFDAFICAIVLQVSEQNSILRGRLVQQLSSQLEVDKFNTKPTEEDLQGFIVASFDKDSQYQLYIIIDSIDNLVRDAGFAEMLESISRLNLRVKVMATCRFEPSEAPKLQLARKSSDSVRDWTINVSREDVLPDIRLLTIDRLQTNNEIYGGLAHLKLKTQCKIRDQIEEKATTLLYADFALRYLGGIGREGAILRELENGLPEEAIVLFINTLKTCKRRLPQDLSSPTQLLLIWLAYSFDLLDLDQANELVQFDSQDRDVRVEEMEYFFSPILRIGPTTKTVEQVGYGGSEVLSEDVISAESVHDDDGNLLVSLRNQSMKEFLRNIDIASLDLRVVQISDDDGGLRASDSSSGGHRLMFLYCCRILGAQRSDKKDSVAWKRALKLKRYAQKYCLRHWQSIDCGRHNQSQNMEVCSAFYNLLADRRGLAAMLELEWTTLDTIVRSHNTGSIEEDYQVFSQTWQSWAKSTDDLNPGSTNDECELAMHKHAEIQTYWQDSPDNALLPLFEAHMENWLQDWCENWDPWAAYQCAYVVLQRTPHEDLSKIQISGEYWKPFITIDESDTHPNTANDGRQVAAELMKTTYLIRTLYMRPLTSTAHFATARIYNFAEKSMAEAQHHELLLAIEKCSNPVQKAEIHIMLGEVCARLADYEDDVPTKEDAVTLRRDKYQEALDHIDAAVEIISDQTSSTRHRALLVRISLLKNFDEIPRGGKIDNEIVEAFHEIKTCSKGPLVGDGNVLCSELLYYGEDHERVVNCFVGLTPSQRISLLIHCSSLCKPWELDGLLLSAAILTKRSTEVLELYDEMLRYLKFGSCEIIWYGALIRSRKAVKNLEMAADLVKEASACVVTKLWFEIGSNYYCADELVEDYLNLASDVIHQRFRLSNRLEVKIVLLQELEAVLCQPLTQSVQLSYTGIIPHLTVRARMYKKIGTYQKHQETLQQAFDMCWANLHDNSSFNDTQNMFCLAKILATIPSFHREAEIASSAQPYYLGKFSDLERFSETRKIVGGKEAEKLEADLGYTTYPWLKVKGLLEVQIINATQPCARGRMGHRCTHYRGWETWDEPAYICLCCTTSILCQGCHDERTRHNNAPGEVENEADFCCDAGEYIKAPMDGWKGIRNGRIYLEGEEPIEFDTFLNQVRDKWKQFWEDFWIGS